MFANICHISCSAFAVLCAASLPGVSCCTALRVPRPQLTTSRHTNVCIHAYRYMYIYMHIVAVLPDLAGLWFEFSGRAMLSKPEEG